jgi:protein-tyrosine phosphatase
MLFLRGKTSLEESGIFSQFTDCHCHILPGVDDGGETMDESLAILSRYEQLGVSEVWLTPHIMEDMPNTTASLRQRFAEFTAAYKGAVKLHLSAENMLDSVFRERFLTDDLLMWGKDGNRLLVETSYYKAPANFHDLLRSIKSKGFFPILAHPERYHYMSPSDYVELKKNGVEMQLNLFSLFGMYGKQVKRNAEFLLEERLYDYVATDLHAYDVLESALREKLCKKTLERVASVCCL